MPISNINYEILDDDRLLGDAVFYKDGSLKTGNGSTIPIGSVPVKDFGVSVKDYGAVGDGVTDDAAAIRSAIAAVQSTGGVVMLPPGTYGVKSDISVPNRVSLLGGGAVTLLALPGASFTRALLIVGEYVVNGGTFPNGGYGNREGSVSNIYINCNDIAPMGLYVGGAVQRHFERIDVRNALSVGVSVDCAQNNTFISCGFENNGQHGTYDTNLLLDRGAGNNRFISCEISARTSGIGGRYNVLIRQTGTSPNGAFLVPTSNVFIGSVVERSASTYYAGICQKAGAHNTFLRCDINVWHSIPAVSGDTTDSANSYHLTLSHCTINGGGFATALSITNNYKWYVHDLFVEACAVGLTSSASGSVNITGDLHFGGVATPFAGNLKVLWHPYGGKPGVSGDRGDASVTLAVAIDYVTQLFSTPLTTARTVALPTTDISAGAKFKVIRKSTASGASTLTVSGGGVSKALAAGQWCDVEYTGSAWEVTATGSL